MLATRTRSPISGRSLGWYARRLSVMQASELWARVGSQCGLAMLSLRHRLGLTPPTEGLFDFRLHRFCTANEALLPLRVAHDRMLDDALTARVLGGGLPEEGWGWCWHPDGEVWHRDGQTGRLWPRRFFGSIQYREGNPYGDVRQIWEPARLQQLVVLGLIAAQSDESTRDKAVSLLEAQFLSWVGANPLHTGVHYLSAMECGLRLIAVCHAFDLIRGWIHDPERVWPAVLQLVDGHATLIQQRVSLHSSLGNHTVAEAVALVYAGILFPEMPRAEERHSLGLRLLESEAVHQILPDGGGAEQGFWYLRFISDLYGLVAGLLSSRGHGVPERIQRALKQSRSFLGTMGDSAGRIPTIGDSDNGYALSPLLSPSHEAQEKTPLATFFSSGYSVLHGQGSARTSLIFDHGPLGMGPCFAHGHADALSVLFRAEDEEFLVDPGTFAYSEYPEWRTYFRGTRAHNTVVVDSLDQAVQETAFQWSSPYSVRLVTRKELSGGKAVLIAVHDGYKQRTGVLHYRGILSRGSQGWVIVDLLSGAGYHTLELNWHLGSTPVPSGAGYVITRQRAQLYLTVDGGRNEVLRGHEHPAAGWYSPFYGHREPLDTLQVTYQGFLPHEFVTCFAVESHDDADQQSAVSLLKDLMYETQTH